MNELNPLEQAVYDLIPRGFENKRVFKELNAHLERRSFDHIISALRRKGKVIGAVRGKHGGYFVATNEEERGIALRQLEAQLKTEMRLIAAMKVSELETVESI